MGAGLTAKSLWYPHYQESQPGHETWMTLFPKTRTHGHRRTQKHKYLGNECTTVSIKQPAHPYYELTDDTCMWPFPAGMWPLVWGRTMMGMSALIRQTSVVSQDGQVLQWVTLECVKVFPHPVIPSMTRCVMCLNVHVPAILIIIIKPISFYQSCLIMIWASSLSMNSPKMRIMHPIFLLLVLCFRKCVMKHIVLETQALCDVTWGKWMGEAQAEHFYRRL